MANEYMNAASWDANPNPPSWMRGGLAGFTAGQDRGTQGDILQRQFAASDLEQQGKQLAYQEMVDNVPLKAARREEEMAGLEDQKRQRAAGADVSSELIRKHIQAMDDDQLKKVKNMAERQEQGGKFAQQLDQQIGDSATIPPHLKPQIDAMIEANGFPKLPDDPVEARAAIKKAAEGYNNSGLRLEHAQKLASEEERARIAARSRQSVAETRVDGALDVQDAKGTAAAAKAAATPGKGAPAPKIGATEEDLMRRLSTEGPSAIKNEGDLAILEERLIRKLDPAVQKDLVSKLDAIDGSDDSPAEKQRKKDEARLRVMGTPWKIVMDARARINGTASGGAAKSGPSVNSVEDGIKAAGQLPDGGTITIQGQLYKKQGNKLVKVK